MKEKREAIRNTDVQPKVSFSSQKHILVSEKLSPKCFSRCEQIYFGILLPYRIKYVAKKEKENFFSCPKFIFSSFSLSLLLVSNLFMLVELLPDCSRTENGD